MMQNKFSFQFQNLYVSKDSKKLEKFSRAFNLAEKCINSDEFENAFLSTAFTQLGNYSGKTNQELLLMFRQPVFLNYYVVPRPWYKRYSSVVGWTIIKETFLSPIGRNGIGSISTYDDQFNGMSVAGLAAHLSHEASHCPPFRFSHDYNWSKARDISLPYAIGNIVEEWVRRNNQ